MTGLKAVVEVKVIGRSTADKPALVKRLVRPQTQRVGTACDS